jgi:hypothetical protein
MRISTKIFIVLSAVFLWGGLFFTPWVFAEDSNCLVPMIPNDMIFVPGAPVVNQQAKIYVTVDPNCDQDVDGAIEFFANDVSLGTTPFSYKASGRTEEVWMSWTPKASGVITMKATLSSPGWTGGTLSKELYIDGDNDNDGAGDLLDTDDDNDGVPDSQDLYPLDPTKAYDTDGDGIDNSADTDDDNDGLSDVEEAALGTDPLKVDTDGDGVSDKNDAFPLDPNKSRPDPPPAPPASGGTTPAEPLAPLARSSAPPSPATDEASDADQDSVVSPPGATVAIANRSANSAANGFGDDSVDGVAAGDETTGNTTDTEYLVVSTAPGSFADSDSGQATEQTSAPAKKGWGSAGMWWGAVLLFAMMAVAFEVKHRTKKDN